MAALDRGRFLTDHRLKNSGRRGIWQFGPHSITIIMG
jgi:hypothetical protein